MHRRVVTDRLGHAAGVVETAVPTADCTGPLKARDWVWMRRRGSDGGDQHEVSAKTNLLASYVAAKDTLEQTGPARAMWAVRNV